jgi:hypothetical protein
MIKLAQRPARLCRSGGHEATKKMKHPDGRKIVFPYHDEVDRYTLKGALKDAEVEVKEFIKHIK